jgi:hypothetical protein
MASLEKEERDPLEYPKPSCAIEFQPQGWDFV